MNGRHVLDLAVFAVVAALAAIAAPTAFATKVTSANAEVVFWATQRTLFMPANASAYFPSAYFTCGSLAFAVTTPPAETESGSNRRCRLRSSSA